MPQLQVERVFFRAFAIPNTVVITPGWDATLAPNSFQSTPFDSSMQYSFADTVVKMEDNSFATRTIDDPPVGEFPRVGEDGYQ